MVIHVRSVTNAEGNTLRNIVRHPKDPIELRMAQVVLSSAQYALCQSANRIYSDSCTIGLTCLLAEKGSVIVGAKCNPMFHRQRLFKIDDQGVSAMPIMSAPAVLLVSKL